MEGALPSVVGGLARPPGDRGADERRLRRPLPRPGRAARACSTRARAGVTVVNIDNGFGAAYASRRTWCTPVTGERDAMRIAWFDAVSGASGDMMLGAAGRRRLAVRRLAGLPARLGLDGGRARPSARARRGAFAPPDRRASRAARSRTATCGTIRDAASSAPTLPPAVRERALEVFTRLGEAEAEVHGTTLDAGPLPRGRRGRRDHRHRGRLPGARAAGHRAVFASPLPLGRGTVRAEHGVLPVPAPATAGLLARRAASTCPLEGERLTPTGAALLTDAGHDGGGRRRRSASRARAWARAGAIRPTGRTCCASCSAMRPTAGRRPRRRLVTVIETALDDATPAGRRPRAPRLLAEGARDAFTTAIGMKKGRPGVLVTVLCDPAHAEPLAGCSSPRRRRSACACATRSASSCRGARSRSTRRMAA